MHKFLRSVATQITSNSAGSRLQLEAGLTLLERVVVANHENCSSVACQTISSGSPDDERMLSLAQCKGFPLLYSGYEIERRIRGESDTYECINRRTGGRMYCTILSEGQAELMKALFRQRGRYTCLLDLEVFRRFVPIYSHIAKMTTGSLIYDAGNHIMPEYRHYHLISPTYGTLLEYVRNHEGGLSQRAVRKLFRQIVEMLAWAHIRGIVFKIHNLSNFVFSDESRTILQLSNYHPFIHVPEVGLGPELVRSKLRPSIFCAPESCGIPPPPPPPGEPQNPDRGYVYFRFRPNDVWSAGVILYALVWGRYVFNDADPEQRVRNVCHREPAYPVLALGEWPVPNDLVALIQLMLAKDPEQRPSAKEILKSSWLRRKRRFKANCGLVSEHHGKGPPSHEITCLHDNNALLFDQRQPILVN